MKKILLFLLIIILLIKDSLEQNIVKCPAGYIIQCKKEYDASLSKTVQHCKCLRQYY